MQSPDCDLVADANDVEIAAEDLIKKKNNEFIIF